jgi:hypothetical protein
VADLQYTCVLVCDKMVLNAQPQLFALICFKKFVNDKRVLIGIPEHLH